MQCEEFQKELALWLEKTWDTDTPGGGPVPAALSGHAAPCPSCRRRLAAAVSLVTAGDRLKTPSPFLAAAVLERLDGAKPRAVRHTVLYSSMAAALAVVIIAAGLIAGYVRRGAGSAESLTVRFTLEAPQAEQVYVVGDWNGWDPAADPLFDEDSDGVWEAEITLDPGREYRYQFYIDESEWVADPNAPLNIDDGFGGENSILRI